MNKIDRIGERNINNFGSEIIIVDYKRWDNIDVYFPEYDCIVKEVEYGNFKKGKIKCPYDKSVFGVGYLGVGKYKVRENDEVTRVYNTWHSMLQRCYDKKYHEKYPTYKNCKVCKEWLNFQNFAKWYEENYYEVGNEKMCLDKDILIKHNKVYSPDTCVFVPHTINMLFTKNNSKRGESVIGTSPTKNGKYKVYCNLLNPKTGKSKQEYLGRYYTEIEAFQVYKYYKEKNIKEVADYYFGRIPKKLYQGLYMYEVEIDD